MKCRKITIIAIVVGCCMLSGCANKGVKIYKSTQLAMGCTVSQVYYGTDENEMERQSEEMTRLVNELESNCLSYRKESSEIYGVNQWADRRDVEVSGALKEYITQALEVAERSGGAFDFTIGEIVRLWDIDAAAAGKADFILPSSEAIEEGLSYCGYDKVSFHGNYIEKPSGCYLDMGAVGKGIACDEVYKQYKAGEYASITGGIVSVGGSVVALGEKPDGSSYKVGIIHPRREGDIGVVSIADGEFLSTSGDYERYVIEDGVKYHHIIDPKTGYPASSDVCSVTVVSDSGLLSDALSTACFVLGAEKGLELADSYGAKVLMVCTLDEALVMNDAMKEIFIEKVQ